MRILNIHGAGDVRLDPRNPPTPGDHDVVVKVRACGICGSDLSYIKAGGINRPEGGVMPLGHEAAGEVAAIGRAVTGVEIGQRVVINPMETSAIIGNGGPEGAFTEQVLVSDVHVGQSLLPIPEDVPFEVAALTEPLAVALHGVNRAQVKPGDKVVVFGCGPIGLGMVLWLVDRGIKDVVALDVAPERLERAMALGAQAVINPAAEDVRARLIALHGSAQVMGREVPATDAYLDAAGAPTILNDVVGLAKLHARLVVTAVYMKPVQIDLNTMLMNEMSITTAIGYPTEMPDVVAALPRLKDKARSLISHRYRFEEIIDALKVASTPHSAKVMIDFEPAG
jgi:2-desacetyl-2-hydroxyethyl bacteriochlorophyllide A dehydrogenase